MIEITGRVMHGDHFGRKLGFPTANLDRRSFVRRRQSIKFGIWAGVAVEGKGKKENGGYRAAIVVGPVDKRGLPKLEAHLINFNGSLYGKKLTLYLHSYLRPFKKFATEQDLREAIGKDIEKIKKYKLIAFY